MPNYSQAALALMAVGGSLSAVARERGVDVSTVSHELGGRDRLQYSTLQAISELYGRQIAQEVHRLSLQAYTERSGRVAPV